jgi:YfiH family protein
MKTICCFSRKKISSRIVFIFKLRSKVHEFQFIVPTRSIGSSPEELCALTGLLSKRPVQAEQVHGDKVSLAALSHRGKTISKADALITNELDTPLVIRTADCVPLAIFDPVNGAIASVHAGWRGSVAGIAVKTLRKMQRHFDTQNKNCIIAVGPCIGRCCYEVDEKVMAPLKKNFRKWRSVARRKGEGKWMLDLAELNRLQLVGTGVKKSNIVSMGICTSCRNDLFHSYRIEKDKAGRTYSLAVLREI